MCAVSSGTLISKSRAEFLCIRFLEEAIANEEKHMHVFLTEIGHKQHSGQAHPTQSASQCSDCFAAPTKKRAAGRPSTSRGKAPYEQPSK